MSESKQLVIVGTGEMGEIAYEYFTHDSDYEVVGFSAERGALGDNDKRSLYDLPIVATEDLESHFAPSDYSVFVAITYTHFNRARERLYRDLKDRGYPIASYVSSRAFVWHNVELGENCFIFENNVIQHHVRIGDNVILWSGNHLGHRSQIRDNCFISSHVVVSGYCEVGEYTFIGVNSSVRDGIKIGKDCIIGAGSVITKDAEPGQVYVGNPARAKGSAFDTWSIPGAKVALDAV